MLWSVVNCKYKAYNLNLPLFSDNNAAKKEEMIIRRHRGDVCVDQPAITDIVVSATTFEIRTMVYCIVV